MDYITISAGQIQPQGAPHRAGGPAPAERNTAARAPFYFEDVDPTQAYKPTPSWALPLPVCSQCGVTIARVIFGCLLPVAYIEVRGQIYCTQCDAAWRELENTHGPVTLTEAGRQLADDLRPAFVLTEAGREYTPNKPMTASERNERGQFLPGNTTARRGGQARAATLSPEERRAIASRGWQALVAKRFSGSQERAADYLGRMGAWAAEQAAYAGTPLYQPAWENPGPLPAGGEA